jgi:hypothetical protein
MDYDTTAALPESNTADALREALDLIESAWGEHFDPDTQPCDAEVLCSASDCQHVGCVTAKIARIRAALKATGATR